jgi:hypothetical protein
MGRLKKYLTPEAKIEAERIRAHEYYWKNKKQCDEKQRERDKRKRKNMP